MPFSYVMHTFIFVSMPFFEYIILYVGLRIYLYTFIYKVHKHTHTLRTLNYAISKYPSLIFEIKIRNSFGLQI